MKVWKTLAYHMMVAQNGVLPEYKAEEEIGEDISSDGNKNKCEGVFDMEYGINWFACRNS